MEKVSFAWFFLVLFLQRAAELLLCRRNRRRMRARGGRELYPEAYPGMVALHVLFLLSLLVESHPWRIPLDAVTWGALAGLLPVTALRYWAIASLGDNWSTRIVVVPAEPVKRAGPYRYLRHPNYVALVLELLLIPLLLRAPVTLAVFSLGNLLALRKRVRLEEQALREHTDYARRFPRPRDAKGGRDE